MADGESSGAFTFSNPDRKAINALRRFPTLSDVTLRVEEQAISANRIVLASVSPYFLAMFTTDLAEQHQSEVTLHQVDPATLASLVDYAYTGELIITQANVQELFSASNFLQIQSVIKACCQFLIERLEPSNCIDIRDFGHSHDCSELRLRAHKFALRHFRELVATEEFLLLSSLELEELISDRQLYSGEEELFMAVVGWVQHDAPTRKAHFARLLKHVRLPLMTHDFLLSHVEPEPLVRDSLEGCRQLTEAIKYHTQPEQRHTLATERTARRQPEGVQPYLFFGFFGKIRNAYNLSSKKMISTAGMGVSYDCGVVGLDGRIYKVGGGEPLTPSINQCYDSQLNQWSIIAPMSVPRVNLGICTLGGVLYVCGGSEYNLQRSLNSVERYDPPSGIWSSCPPMNTRRRQVCMAAMDNCLYAVGGFEDENCLASVEMWDPRTAGWVFAPSMKSPRGCFGMAAVNDVLYCTGGSTQAADASRKYDCPGRMQSSERFDARLQVWKRMPRMRAFSSGHCLSVAGSSLYAVGGLDQHGRENRINVYSIARNEWRRGINLGLPPGIHMDRGVILECSDLEEAVKRSGNFT